MYNTSYIGKKYNIHTQERKKEIITFQLEVIFRYHSRKT